MKNILDFQKLLLKIKYAKKALYSKIIQSYLEGAICRTYIKKVYMKNDDTKKTRCYHTNYNNSFFKFIIQVASVNIPSLLIYSLPPDVALRTIKTIFNVASY